MTRQDWYTSIFAMVIGGVEPDPAVGAFYSELTRQYPEIDDVPDEEVDDCPWNCEFDRSPGHLIMPCGCPEADRMRQLVELLAQKHGLVVYNPQEGRITYPA
ncbi:MAG: hypothetical protein ACRDF6_14120 [bacterium]